MSADLHDDDADVRALEDELLDLMEQEWAASEASSVTLDDGFFEELERIAAENEEALKALLQLGMTRQARVARALRSSAGNVYFAEFSRRQR